MCEGLEPTCNLGSAKFHCLASQIWAVHCRKIKMHTDQSLGWCLCLADRWQGEIPGQWHCLQIKNLSQQINPMHTSFSIRWQDLLSSINHRVPETPKVYCMLRIWSKAKWSSQKSFSRLSQNHPEAPNDSTYKSDGQYTMSKYIPI